ncbi:MAG: TRAP transporter small permease, partial [Alphaproteobacteria bacterium]|nr:TRAP transporter small permease [Alphaproteobacteria bacterium]
MEGLRRVSDGALRAAAFLLLMALLACVVLGVVSRQLGAPIPWTDEAAQYLLVWTGFVGWILAARRRSHIRIDVFIDWLPGATRRAAEVVIQLCVVALTAAMVWYGPVLIERNLDVTWISVPLSAAILYIPVPIAGFAVMIQALGQIVEA